MIQICSIDFSTTIFLYSIKYNITRLKASKEIEKLIDYKDSKNLYTKSSTNINNICSEDFQNDKNYFSFFIFLKDVFGYVDIIKNNNFDMNNKNVSNPFFLVLNEKVKNDINKEKLIIKINNLIKDLKLSATINKNIFDGKSILKTKFNYFKENAFYVNKNINHIHYGLCSANSKIYTLENGDEIFIKYDRFNVFDFFKMNESNYMIKLSQDLINKNIDCKLKKISIYKYLSIEEIEEIKMKIIDTINKRGFDE